MSDYSVASSSTISSMGPRTPYAASSSYYPSSDDTVITTPPGSLRDYSAKLKARHTMGMAAAMKLIPIDRPPGTFGRDSGGNDNPFDQSFCPSPTPRPTPKARAPSVETEKIEHIVSSDEEEEEQMAAKKRKLDRKQRRESHGLPPFKPALIDFHRKSGEQSISATPTSVSSEASFESGMPEDYFRVYGKQKPQYSPFDLSYYDMTNPSTPSFFQSEPGSPFEASPVQRMSTLSTMSGATVTSISTSSTITSFTSSMSSSTSTAHLEVAGQARMSRPTLLRPRPRQHPYDDSLRSRDMGVSSARGASFGAEEQLMRDDGRSVSEVMVAMAGLRCQRGRAIR